MLEQRDPGDLHLLRGRGRGLGRRAGPAEGQGRENYEEEEYPWTSLTISSYIPTAMEELPGYLEEVLFANLVPLIKGSPAIGKSSIVHQVAEKYKLKLIDFRMAQAGVSSC